MSNNLNAAQLAAQNRKIKAPKRRIAPGANPSSTPLFAPGAPGSTGGGLFGGSVQAAPNNGFNFAAPVGGNASVSFPPAVPGQGTPAKPDGFGMSFAGQPSQPQQGGGLFGNTSTSFGGAASNPFGQSQQPAPPAGGFSFGRNNNQQAASNPFDNTQQNAQSQPPSGSFNFGVTAPAASNPFSFGASQQQPQQSQQTPSFSFGSTAKSDGNSFSQQQNTPAAAPASNLFGGFGANKAEPAKNPFGFNNQAQAGSTVGSQFGGSQPGTRDASPAPFQFGAATPAAETPKANPFQFGATAGASTPAAEKPAASFSFGQTAGTPAAAPANNLFGNNGGSQTPGGNLFGNKQQAAIPAANLFGAKPAEQPKPAASLFGGSSQASQPASTGFSFGQTAGTPAAAPPANNLFGGAKPVNPFGNLNVPASGSSTPFGQPSRSASPEKNMSDAEQKPAPASSLFGGSQTPKPAAPTNMFGAAQAPQTAPQQASKPSLFGAKPAQESTEPAPKKNFFGGLPQPPKAAPAATESPATSNFSAPTPSKPAPSLFAPPQQAKESPKPSSQANLFSGSRAPSKLSEVTNASPAASPVRPSIEKADDTTSKALVQKPENSWKTSTKDLAKASGALTKPVVFDHPNSIVQGPQGQLKRDQEIYAAKSEEEVQAMFELYVARAKTWDENEFLNPYSYRKIAMMCAKFMKSNMSEREQLEAYCLVQIRIAQRRAKEAFDNAEKDEDREKQLKIKYFYEYKEKDILRWAERQVDKSRRRAMDLQYEEEEYEDRRRSSKRTAKDFDDEERLQIEENPTAKRRKASPPVSPPKLLTNGESGSTTPKAPPPAKSIFGNTPAAGIQKNVFGASSTPAAAPPAKPMFGASPPATIAKAAQTPAPAATPSAPTPSGSDTPKSKRKAEAQFDKDDPYGEKAAAASAKWAKSGSATASLFKSIVGKGGASEGANGTPERKILTPGKKVDTPKANPFAALPGASSPAPAAKANPFGGLPSPAPKSPTKANPFAGLPKSPTKAAAPAPPAAGGFVFKPSAPAAGEAPKANPFQLKGASATPTMAPAAPTAGGFKPTVSLDGASDAFAKAAAAAKKKARRDEMEKAKDDDWDSEGSVDEDEWEKRYWKKKEKEEKEFQEKINNPTLKVPSFGSFGSNASNKSVEEAKDISRSGTQSPNSVLDSHQFGSGKITGAAAKNPFAHLSAATSPASSGKNDADDEEDKEKSDEKSAETPKGDLFSRTSFDPKAASATPTTSLFGSASKAADQTFKHDTPLKFAPTTTPATNIFGASTAAPTSLFGSKPASGTSTPSAAPKAAGFSFGATSTTETPAAKPTSLFGNKISETPIPPPKPFSFLTNGKASGVTAASSLNTSRATTPGLTTEGEATADEAAASGDADPETKHEQLKDLASGEEAGEETLWISRAKASELKGNKWDKALIGTLKVLKNKETGRVRYLMRLDNGSVTLNKAYIKDKPQANSKSVRIPMPNGEGEKPSVWNITTKTPEQVQELASVVAKAGKD